MARQYSNSGKTITVALYQFRDSSGAYSALTLLRNPDMVDSDLTPYAAVNRDHALLLVGNLLVDLAGIEAATISDLRELVAKLGAVAENAPLPQIREFLPSGGAVSGSWRYVTGAAGFLSAIQSLDRPALAPLAKQIGFDFQAEAMLARYRRGHNDGVILLLQYPTPQIAGRFQKHIEQALAASGTSGTSDVRRTGSLLSMVLPPASPEYAAELLSGVRYETVVTQNESSARLTDPPWPVMIVNTILGTGVILVAAFVLGIAFGGVRVFTKMLLPGKVFDRPQDMEILQLGIGSKPIDARDFYSDSRR